MNITEVKDIWNEVKLELEKSLPSIIYSSWIVPLEAANYENNTLLLLTPQQLAIEMLKKSCNDEIKQAVKSVLGEDATFSIMYDEEYSKVYMKARKKELSQIKAGADENYTKAQIAKSSLAQMQSSANLNLNLKFDKFVVGANSQFAYNAAFAVANNPAKKFNPLFIYGASGLGKTHLLQAIGHHLIFNEPKLKVRYIRAQEYFQEWVKCFQYMDNKTGKPQSCNNSQMRKFHQKFENIDVLLVDDIQIIESKAKTMIEFFSTFEALYTNNKQIVLASDRLPKDMPKLDNRLRTRFEMGLMVDIVPPDFQTRYEIVKAYARELEVEAEDEVFKYVADNFANNVRELKGAFNKVCAFAEFMNLGVTLSTAQKALNCAIKKNEITCDKVANVVADYMQVDKKDLLGTARQKKIAQARHIAIYLCREILQLSYEAIGEYFNKKHTTIMYSYELIEEAINKNQQDTISMIEELKSELKD